MTSIFHSAGELVSATQCLDYIINVFTFLSDKILCIVSVSIPILDLACSTLRDFNIGLYLIPYLNLFFDM